MSLKSIPLGVGMGVTPNCTQVNNFGRFTISQSDGK